MGFPRKSRCESSWATPANAVEGSAKGQLSLFVLHLYHRQPGEGVSHSLDSNLRSCTLNSKLDFYLEGVSFEDIIIENEANDVARMALSKSVWLECSANWKLAGRLLAFHIKTEDRLGALVRSTLGG